MSAPAIPGEPFWSRREPDWVEVDRLARGASPAAEVHPAARAEVVRRLTDEGLSLREIGERTGMSKRSVERYRARWRRPGLVLHS